ncbi:hypothetical protein [Corynebacterium sp. HMSC04H06]|uniref:hypothetical protein n=1 Tax=Corynebacterium sp. HMSC04H06 TaxID=1581050 RepID=UPI0008A243DA|nr:hypothetical protein [Corynebacterium sp. HMSC04H06]OFS22930.1 hypothetical protein HMPREF3067_02780 [Corynebacterium sp. HMSC04H06]
MQKLTRTLTAGVLAAALTLGGTVVAQAQENPMSLTVDGTEYYKNAEGKYVSGFGEDATELTGTELDNALNEWREENHFTSEGESGDAGEEGAPAENEGIPGPATIEEEGTTWYQSAQDKGVYVDDPAKVNEPVTDEMRAASDAMLAEYNKQQGEEEKDYSKLAWLALPAALIIGGVTWYLMQDGKTYTQDKSRVNEQPTAEEKAASEELLAANKDEVIAQGGKLDDAAGAQSVGTAQDTATAPRGMAAETGSNTVARGLIALAVVAMAGAAAFVARRKFFA